MKIIHSTILALAIGAASITSAQAHDSFSFGLNIGSYGYAPPPVVYYPAPVYYSEPVYYQSEPRYYSYAPLLSYRYFDDGFRGHHRGWGHGEHEEHEHHGGHEGRERGGWDHDDRGHHDGHH